MKETLKTTSANTDIDIIEKLSSSCIVSFNKFLSIDGNRLLSMNTINEVDEIDRKNNKITISIELTEEQYDRFSGQAYLQGVDLQKEIIEILEFRFPRSE